MTSRLRLGTVLSFSDLALAELICSHMDLVWIDLEHSTLTPRDVRDLAIAARASGCEAYVRIPDPHTENLAALLDAGVDGVVIPQVTNADSVARVLRKLAYPPSGERGYAPRRATLYLPRLQQSRLKVPQCVVQIENAEGIAAAEDIAALRGVDALVVGCADLALALGLDGPLEQPMADAIRHVAGIARTAGCSFGLAGLSVDTLPLLRDVEVALIVTGSDARLVAGALDALEHQVAATAESLSVARSPHPEP